MERVRDRAAVHTQFRKQKTLQVCNAETVSTQGIPVHKIIGGVGGEVRGATRSYHEVKVVPRRLWSESGIRELWHAASTAHVVHPDGHWPQQQEGGLPLPPRWAPTGPAVMEGSAVPWLELACLDSPPPIPGLPGHPTISPRSDAHTVRPREPRTLSKEAIQSLMLQDSHAG